MPDARLGERACAFVVLRERATLDFERMQHYLHACQVAKKETLRPERLEIVGEAAAHAVGQGAKVRAARPRSRSAATRTRQRSDLVKQLAPETPFDEAAFAALKDDVAAYVRGRAEGWAGRDRRERRVPLELWEELCERGYLSLAAPAEYGGRAIPFTRYLELIELFSMSARLDPDDRSRGQRYVARDG